MGARSGFLVAKRSAGSVVTALKPQDLAEIRRSLGPRLLERYAATPSLVAGLSRREILVCAGGGCLAAGSGEIADALEAAVVREGLDESLAVVRVGCLGLCGDGPILRVTPGDRIFTGFTVPDGERLLEKLAAGGDEGGSPASDNPFFALQRRRSLRRCGIVDPESLNEVVALGGYRAAALAVAQPDRRRLVESSFRAAMREAGGARAQAASHWFLPRSPCLVCHVGSGDPGAVGDLRLVEGDPHGVVEGLILGALASGASHGYVVLPAGGSVAACRARTAVTDARSCELLGSSVLGSGQAFDVHVLEGVEAAVTGDDTALAAALEGRRPMPRPGPPAVAGQSLVTAGAELWAKLPLLFLERSGVVRSRSPATRVLALTGDVTRRGVVEVPVEMPLSQAMEEMGDPTRPILAAHAGGLLGNLLGTGDLDLTCLAAGQTLTECGTLVALDSTAGLVRVVRRSLRLLAEESCGKCPPCRVGSQILCNGFEELLEGDGDPQLLRRMARHVEATADCRLGRSAARLALAAVEELFPDGLSSGGASIKMH